MGGRVSLVMFALLALGAAGCGLVLDLDPPDGTRDGGGVSDAGPSPSDGGNTLDASTDGAAMPGDAAVADGGSPEAGTADAGLPDAGPTDAGALPTYCTPRDCDGDGFLEDLVTDPDHCGACGHACGLLEICCNGECVEDSTCAPLC